MAYADLTDLADIKRYYPGVIDFSTVTTPSSSDIEFWIKEGTAIIYSVLKKYYSVPITNENDLIILKSYCRQYVIANIQYTLARMTTVVQKGGVLVPRSISLKSFYSSLALIEDGSLELETAKISTITAYSYNADNNIIAFSKKDEDQY